MLRSIRTSEGFTRRGQGRSHGFLPLIYRELGGRPALISSRSNSAMSTVSIRRCRVASALKDFLNKRDPPSFLNTPQSRSMIQAA
jgi:hypothetical protein